MASTQETDSTSNDSKESVIDNLLEQMQKIDLKSDSSRDVIIIPEWSKTCESPFLWDSQERRGLGAEQIVQRSILKLEELKIEEPGFSMERFIAMLRLILEYYITNELDKSWESMKTVEDLLEKEASSSDPLYHKVKLSLGHVITSTKVHLLALTGEEETSQKIAQDIIPTKIMNNKEQAALYAMKARFFLYTGYENGEAVSVGLARKALELEPDNEELKYLLAKMLRQERRSVQFSLDIPREELTLLESAVEKTRNPKYLVYLAQVYRECATQAFKQYKDRPNFFKSDLNRTIQDMQAKSLKYYKESYELSPNSSIMLRRIGYGIMYLPKKMADYDFALKCLLRSLEIAENTMTLHVLGTFYHRFGNDNAKALEYFEKTVKFESIAGLSDMIRVKYLMNPEYNPCEDFEAGLKWRMKKKDRMHLIVQLGGYYLLIKRDFNKSIDYFSQALVDGKDSPIIMKTFKSFFLRMDEPINLYEYIVNEALLLLQKARPSASLDTSVSDDEERNVSNVGQVEDFLDKVSDIYPELMEVTPDPFLITKLHYVSKEIQARQRNSLPGFKKFRGYNKNGNEPQDGMRGNNQRARGHSSRGRGTSSDITSERRGRFSVANQRDKETCNDNSERRRYSSSNERDLSGDDNSDRKEKCSSPQQRTGEKYQRRDGFYRQSPKKSKENESHQSNWRKKD